MADQSDQQLDTPPAEAQKTDTAEHMIPKARFDEVNGELQKLRRAQQQAEQAAKAESDRQAAAKGEFEKLANERGARVEALERDHATATERLTSLTEAMEAQIKARIKGLPDELKDMIPDTADVLTRYDLVGKAEVAATKLTAPASPPRPPLRTPQGGGTGTTNTSSSDLLAQKRASGEYVL